MVARILNIISWIGVALVVAALAIFVTRPAMGQYAKYMAWTGLVFVLLYPIVMWREIASQFTAATVTGRSSSSQPQRNPMAKPSNATELPR